MLVPRQGTPESIIEAALKGQRDAERRFGKKKPHGEYEGRLALGLSQRQGLGNPMGSRLRVGHARQLKVTLDRLPEGINPSVRCPGHLVVGAS